ncbi:MAG: crotonase/enoyl-CoA hydratase family protein [Polyangiaceae bacterium]|nr:crotonase/enoyl-CoA hydratase family protein [Polyangiaceae bacterium]
MERITFERLGRVAKIGLNRAAKRNAFDLLMLRELAQAITDYEEDRELWCAVLFAHGDHFTAGLELNEVGPAVASGAPFFPEGLVDPLGLQARVRTKPLVTAVQGYCLTIGIELLLASDIRLAADTTKLGQIEIKRGIMPFGGATMRMPAMTGWGNAMRYLLTGDMFDAAEALRIGLVQEVTSAADLVDRATALATRVAAQAPLGVQATLASARHAMAHGEAAETAKLLDRTREIMKSEDAMEGVRSFLERREAVFRGK